MGLRRYQKMRDFEKTPEPKGFLKKGKGHSFVIQKHAARALHYDFRLEMDGVLKSWAVPKGLPTKRGVRRLAMHVEDHPLSYADFEGIIPAGNYGGGSVMVWDYGTFEVQNGGGEAALRKGKLEFRLAGKKLKGDWALIRMRRDENGKEPWLIIKHYKDMKELTPRQDDRSALTGRTMKQIAEEKKRVWKSNRPEKESPKSKIAAAVARSSAKKAPKADSRLPGAKAAFVEPMKALLVEKLPAGDWQLELKFDGIRALIVKQGKKVQVLSRNRKDYSARFAAIAAAVAALPVQSAVLDGEVVALDEKGRSSFQLLQAPLLQGATEVPLFFYGFDLLQLDGRDLKSLPLGERKEKLSALIAEAGDPLRFSSSLAGKAEPLLKKIRRLGLEGLIAKRSDSLYESGRRSGAWLKLKVTQRQEFVIGGFTEPRGSRSSFGALVVGYYEGKDLKFASKVGTGFDRTLLESLHRKMKALVRKEAPFSDLPQPGPHGIPPHEMKRCTWLRPQLVAEIRFSEWTREGHLRHPVFVGLRTDLSPRDIHRERPVSPSSKSRKN